MRELVAVLFLVFVEQSLFCLQNFAFKSGRALIMKRLDVIFSSYKPNSSIGHQGLCKLSVKLTLLKLLEITV